MKITALTLGFLLLTNFSFSQIKKKELSGIWKTNSELFFKTDTIKFYPNIKDCYQTKWTIEKRKFKTNELNVCKEPTRISGIINKEKLKLRKTDFGQILKYYHDKTLIAEYRIVELNKNKGSELKLMQFDKLTEQKLYKYVDSLIHKVLKYKPSKKSIENDNVLISDSNQHAKITIRNNNPEPLIVVNGYPLIDKKPLRELLLVETYGIKYIKKEQSISLYGSLAINGIIILQTSEKRFKAVRKKYCRQHR